MAIEKKKPETTGAVPAVPAGTDEIKVVQPGEESKVIPMMATAVHNETKSDSKVEERVVVNMTQNVSGLRGRSIEAEASIKWVDELIRSKVGGDCLVDFTKQKSTDEAVNELIKKYDPISKGLILASLFANGALEFTTKILISQQTYVRKLTPAEDPDAIVGDKFALDLAKIRQHFGSVLPTDKAGVPAVIHIVADDGRICLYVDIFKVILDIAERLGMTYDKTSINNRKIGAGPQDMKLVVGYEPGNNPTDSFIKIKKFI